MAQSAEQFDPPKLGIFVNQPPSQPFQHTAPFANTQSLFTFPTASSQHTPNPAEQKKEGMKGTPLQATIEPDTKPQSEQ